MAKTRYAPDRGLTARMTLTMFLLGLVFVAFIVVLVYLLSAFGVGSGAIVFFAVLLGAGLTIGSFFYSDKIALSAARAVEVGLDDGPMAAKVHGIVDRLCALADMPKPKVAVARSPIPNAFATGRNAKKAVVCATTALTDGRLETEGAGGRPRPRDVARRAQGRRGDDHRLVPGGPRRPAGQVRVLRGTVRRRRRRGRGGNNNNNGGGAIVLLVMLAVGTWCTRSASC